MDLDTALVLGLLLVWIIGVTLAVTGTIDVFGHAPEAWVEAGCNRAAWVWQVALVLFIPGALVYSGIYYLRVRPRLVAAERAFAQADPAYAERSYERRWYQRFSRAHRSPADWALAARRWWQWALSMLIGVLAAGFELYLAASARTRGGRPEVYTGAALQGVLALLSAARAGFWYGEHMRLSGRRPVRGGPLTERPGSAPRPVATYVRPKAR